MIRQHAMDGVKIPLERGPKKDAVNFKSSAGVRVVSVILPLAMKPRSTGHAEYRSME
jgi:hypothetical protein